MAKDELESITEDNWDDEIWGIEHPDGESGSAIPKLVFFFGRHVRLPGIQLKKANVMQDQWVSNHIRDELIAARGKGGEDFSSSKPLMLIDENEVPHSFCIGKLSTCPSRQDNDGHQSTAKKLQKGSSNS
jgi:hypothetical protein